MTTKLKGCIRVLIDVIPLGWAVALLVSVVLWTLLWYFATAMAVLQVADRRTGGATNLPYPTDLWYWWAGLVVPDVAMVIAAGAFVKWRDKIRKWLKSGWYRRYIQ